VFISTQYCQNIFELNVLLLAGYWASYNVPFYEQIYNLSGYPDVVKQKGTDFSYSLAPRAKIFRRDQASVTDMDSMKNIMRYNGNLVSCLVALEE